MPRTGLPSARRRLARRQRPQRAHSVVRRACCTPRSWLTFGLGGGFSNHDGGATLLDMCYPNPAGAIHCWLAIAPSLISPPRLPSIPPCAPATASTSCVRGDTSSVAAVGTSVVHRRHLALVAQRQHHTAAALLAGIRTPLERSAVACARRAATVVPPSLAPPLPPSTSPAAARRRACHSHRRPQ